MPNPSANSAAQIEPLLCGAAPRRRAQAKETQLALSLPSVVWKQLVGQRMDSSDLDAIDHLCKQRSTSCATSPTKASTPRAFSDVIFETFTTQLSDGTEASAGRLNFSHRKSTKGGWEGAVCLSVHGDLCP